MNTAHLHNRDMTPEQVKDLAMLERVTAAGRPTIKTRSDGKQFVSVDWLAIAALINQQVLAALEEVKSKQQHLLYKRHKEDVLQGNPFVPVSALDDVKRRFE